VFGYLTGILEIIWWGRQTLIRERENCHRVTHNVRHTGVKRDETLNSLRLRIHCREKILLRSLLFTWLSILITLPFPAEQSAREWIGFIWLMILSSGGLVREFLGV
jgi:hypothetical protein